jgi:hypothetical protein
MKMICKIDEKGFLIICVVEEGTGVCWRASLLPTEFVKELEKEHCSLESYQKCNAHESLPSYNNHTLLVFCGLLFETKPVGFTAKTCMNDGKIAPLYFQTLKLRHFPAFTYPYNFMVLWEFAW